MELLRTKASRTRVSEIFYLGFNAILPIILLLLVRGFDPPYLALAVVFLSKWRIFALRPRFWLTNIKANMVDILVGISMVGLLYLALPSLPFQIVLTVLYVCWLLVIKPKSSPHGIMLQAGVAQFLGLVVLFHFSTVVGEFFVILGSFIIGFVAARHVVSNYEESYTELWSAVWGLLLAQLGWLAFYWTTIYDVNLPVRIPQIALLMLVFGFSAARLYHLQKHERLTPSIMRATALFTMGLLAVILVFSPWDATL